MVKLHSASVLPLFQLVCRLFRLSQLSVITSIFSRGVHLGRRVDSGLGVLGQFEIGFCVHIVFCIIVDHF